MWLLAKTLSEDEATEAIEFNVDADRSLTAGMLVQVILGKVSSKTYDVDPAAYEVRFPDIPSDDEAGGGDSDGEGASPEPPTIRGDATLPPLGLQQPVFQANSKTLVIQARAKPTVGLKMKTRVSIASFERDRSRFPTLAQLSPEELDEYFEKHDLKESSRGHITCVVRLAISPLCAAKLVGGSGRDAQQLSGCIPQSILVRAGSRLTVEGLVKIFLSSLSKGLESTWRDWMVRKTGSSSLDTIDNGRSEFWMHQGGAQLGDVLDADARVSDTVPWQTVVLLPRTSKYSLETKHDKQGEEGRSASKPKVTYLFTEQTATMYVEYAVVKVNRYGKRQGADLQPPAKGAAGGGGPRRPSEIRGGTSVGGRAPSGQEPEGGGRIQVPGGQDVEGTAAEQHQRDQEEGAEGGAGQGVRCERGKPRHR